MSGASEVLRLALGDRPAWLVGGAVRDRALGRRASEDHDVVIDGDPAQAAKEVARAARRGGEEAACFALSEEFGAWRVIARDGSWQVDVEPLRGGSLDADLALRDFTVDAIAEPISGGAPIDPLKGLEDLALGRLRMAGPRAFIDDPLRVLRLVRIAVELGLEPEGDTVERAREAAGRLKLVSGERVFIEISRILACERAIDGLESMSDLGASAVVLPEIEAMRGVGQSHFHHLDVHDHTIEVLRQVIALQSDPGEIFSESERERLAGLLAEPLADGLTRGDAMRWGALLHDIAKPLTKNVRQVDGRVTFIGHDLLGAQLARTILGRLRTSERLRAHVGGLVRNHLRLGFLVHESRPLPRRSVFAYLRACEPVEVDVTVLSCADRLSTRGERAPEAIEEHLDLARGMIDDALRWRAEGPPTPLLRGDELADALQIEPGPRLGALIEELSAAQFSGEVQSVEQAIAHLRAMARSE